MTYVDVKAAAESLRILLVEDNPADAHLLDRMLRSAGKEFVLAHVASLRAALERINTEDFDLVILDLNLPDATELNGLIQLRDSAGEIPIIVLTGTTDESLAITALHLGAEDYLVKGELERNLLVRSIRYAVERHRGVRELANVTKQLQLANASLERLTLLDPLTELLNRRGLQQALSREIERLKRDRIEVVVLFIDIDDLKSVNDTLGHAVGDIALKEVARKLRTSVRGIDYVARIGGDEFMVLLPKAKPSNVVRIAERLRLAIATTTIRLNTETLHITASSAALMLTEDTPSIDELLIRTHQILGRSKAGGKNRVSYAHDQFDDTDRRMQIQSDMCFRLAEGRGIVTVSQPIYRLADEVPVGIEYLSRYEHETLEMPHTFFNLCAERNLLTLVDHHCLRRAVQAASAIAQDADIHFNIFPSTLVAIPTEHILQELQTLPPERICLEISEQQILGEPSHLREPVRRLRDAGIRIAIDDVGYGNTCLESLVVLEPEVVKIDKRCVREASGSTDRRRILQRYIRMANELTKDVIVEGIETREDFDLMRDLGVEYGQGFLWGMPA